MSLMDVIESHPMITWPVLLLLFLVLLYLARHQMHPLNKSFTRVTSQALRLASVTYTHLPAHETQPVI